ncbi:MAG: GNAT family N-acetyltransferase [Intrasporangium sp.]|uniref:GNAT family N-acetyltransferase n=1 Tax=Intrasporangium sp. TaxID=1925024 RepID=UPI002649733A|nr:GNAT family N-acetyltransferase [Intrasporangium sp.]MDN5797848.1 GNAT family N-acetyltransferase [Intrasporangium sp.]
MSAPRPVPATRLTVTSVRPARPADLPLLQPIEAAADRRFAAFFDLADWPAPPTGQERAAEPGFLLVVGQPVVGFAHVLELGPDSDPHLHLHLHLQKVSVHPDAARHGLGTMLLLGALGEALDRGHDQISLMTFADQPWNAPWYARYGFTELDAHGSTGVSERTLSSVLAPLRRTERRLELDRLGRRVAMVRPLADQPIPIPAVSVIPLRMGPAGLEVFVQHRAATMDFVPGAVVFPGGRVDPGDNAAGARLALPPDLVQTHAWRWRHTAQAGPDGLTGTWARTLLATGLRELAEETGACVAPDRLVPWDNWVTPIGYRKRFDVSFYVLPVEQDTLSHTTTEATRSEWLPLDDLVERAEARELALVAPTRTIVDELQALGSLEAALELQPTIRPVRHDVTPLRPRGVSRGRVGP